LSKNNSDHQYILYSKHYLPETIACQYSFKNINEIIENKYPTLSLDSIWIYVIETINSILTEEDAQLLIEEMKESLE